MTELKSMKMNQLVQLHNNLNPKKAATMKTFNSKAKAIARINELAAANEKVEKEAGIAQGPKKDAPSVGRIAGKGKIGRFICAHLTQDEKVMSHKAILDALKETYPNSRTSIGCVSWYASKLRAAGIELPRSRSASAVKVDAI